MHPFFLLLLLFSLAMLPNMAVSSPKKPLKFTFCYENKTLLPHFTGVGRHVPAHNPGAAIEVLQALNASVDLIDIHFVRFPWKRCLSDLRHGDIDGVIGRYSDDRAEFAVYPRNSEGELDFTKSMINTETCFIYNRRVPLTWDGNTLKFGRALTISVPGGYELINDLRNKGANVYEAENVNIAHRLLFTGRVDASVSNCKLKNLPHGFVQNPIPVVSNPGFLVFSQHFYHRFPEHAEVMWNALRDVDKKAIYEKYSENVK